MSRPPQTLKPWYWFWAAGPIAAGVWFLAALSPHAVEFIYSRGVYPFFMAPLARLMSSVPIALAPILGLVVVAAAVSGFLVWPPSKALGICGAGLSLVMAWFILGWGLNYHRQSWADSHGWKVSGGTVAELADLAEHLADRAIAVRPAVENVDWRSNTFRFGVSQAYERAGRADSLLSGRWGSPKLVPLPDIMSWLGLAGIFIPFTGEPLVNGGPNDWQLPFTMAHEAAHLRGWAREDEANFLAFWVLRNDPEPALAYSAWSSALLYVAQALEGTELGAQAWKRIAAKLPPPIRDDWKKSFAYWDRFRGPARDAAGAINDAFLKSQGQNDGVRSYGRMVDLLLSSFRSVP